MPAMIRGSEATFAFMPQATPGTLPVGNWNTGNFYTENFAPGQALEADPELGGARNNPVDPTDPAGGLDSPSGTLSTALDLNQIGHFLKSMLGAPVTTGLAPDFVHTFTSGKDVLPALAMQFAAGADVFKIAEYLAIAQASFDLAPAGGYRKVDLTTVPRRVYDAASNRAGTPVAAPARAKVPGSVGIARFNGTLAGNIIGGKIDYANGAAGERYADDSASFSSIDPGDPSFKASPEIRIRKTLWASLRALFDGATAFAFEIEYQIAAATMLTITAPRCFGQIVIPEFGGPGGVSVTPEITGAQDAANPMVSMVLKNQVASY